MKRLQISFIKLQKYAQILLSILFILFIIFPTDIPFNIAKFVESSLGIIMIFVTSIALFCYANPFLAFLFIVVAYVLLCKCFKITRNTQNIQYTPVHKIVDSHMVAPRTVTLEEQVVSRMAPLGNKETTDFIDSSFKPMYNNLNSASSF
jgi:hypothetical protein